MYFCKKVDIVKDRDKDTDENAYREGYKKKYIHFIEWINI